MKVVALLKQRAVLRGALQLDEPIAARQHGFNLNDLTSRSRGGGRGRRNAANPAAGAEPAPGAKYANPDEPAQTWSGRGRRPRWVTEQLEAGRSLEDMRA